MAFQLLGTMLINGRAAVEVLPGTRARQLLATLLQHPNRFVSFDTIIDNLWSEKPPKSTMANLRTHVGSVRRALAASQSPVSLITQPGGYSIKVAPHLVDTSRIDELLVEAHHLVDMGDHEQAVVLIDEALALWRGAPFEDLDLRAAWQPQIARWEQMHAELVSLAVRLHVEYGDPWRAAGLIRERLDTDPYDEHCWAQLVRCYLAGGVVDQAVAALNDARQVLATDLGVDPGPELAELEVTVRDESDESGLRRVAAGLVDDDSGWTSGWAESDQPRGRSVPSQLPHDLSDFTGRSDELARTVAQLRRRPDARPEVLIITGPPGVGKTALVTHAAHQLRDAFPDGQIYLDLRGTTAPLSAPFAVTEVLSAIGISNPSDELDRAAALLRSELASRRVLLVADNAATAEQIAPLLPGTGDSAVLVTSRRRLTEVVGATVIDLDVLSVDDAVEMVGRIAGVEDDQDRLRIAEACGCHPLALRIACGRLLRRPDLKPAALAARLADPGRALDELTLGEMAFRTSAQLSCSALDETAARGFRTLGALELGEFGGLTVEAAAGSVAGPAVGSDVVDALLEENLLQANVGPNGQVGYVMHDLLRWHARGWAAEVGDQVADHVRAVVQTWVAVSRRAADALPSYYFGPQPQAEPVELDPAWAEQADDPSGSWFDNERQRLDAMVASALNHGHVDLAWRLVVSWSPYFDLRGHTRAWISALEKVLAPVREAGDLAGEASVLRDVGQVLLYRDEPLRARQALTGSRELFLQQEDWGGAGVASIGLASTASIFGEVDDQLRRCREALDWFERAGHRPGVAVAHNAIALVHLNRRDFDGAEPWLTSAAEIAEEVGDRHRFAQVLRRRADLHVGTGDVAAAEAALRSALEIFLELGDHRCAGYASTRLGRLLLAGGDCPGARRQFREALEAGRRLADPAAQAAAWDAMADALLVPQSQAADEGQAITCLQRSVRAWQVADQPARAADAADRLERLAVHRTRAVRTSA